MVFAGLQDGSVVALNPDEPVLKSRRDGCGFHVGTTAGTVRETNPVGTRVRERRGHDHGRRRLTSPIQGHIDALQREDRRTFWRWFSTPDPAASAVHPSWTNPVEAARRAAERSGSSPPSTRS